MNVGIIAAKSISKRLPGKNVRTVGGVPLFWYSVQPLLDAKTVDKVYVATDSMLIKEYCEDKGVSVIWRNINAIRPEDPLISVLRYAYYSIEEPADAVVTIMANCPGHTSENVDKLVNMFYNKKLQEVRSFDGDGEENGLMIYSKDIMQSNRDISYYIGCMVTDSVKEIHYEEDLNDFSGMT